MPRLTALQFVALILFAPLAMTACDVPIPTAGGGATAEPVWSDDASVVQGELSDADEARSTGQKQDRVARVTVPAGATLQVLMESDTFDTFLLVEAEGSEQSFSNDDFNGSTRRSYLSQINPSGDTFVADVYASAYGATARGTYTVRMQILDAPEAPTANTISIPGRYSGTLSARTPEVPLLMADDARRADAYSFSLGSGQTATVRMESAAFDTYLKVLRNGAFAERNDDFSGSRSVSQVELTQPGTYTVFAGTFGSSGAGDYILSVQTNGGTSAPEASAEASKSTPSGTSGDGGVQQASITDGDREVALTIAGDVRKVDAYEVELDAGETLVAEMESTDFDTYLKVVRGDEFIARNDDAGSTRRSAIRQTVSQSGTYTIYAGTFSESGRGPYTFRWSVE